MCTPNTKRAMIPPRLVLALFLSLQALFVVDAFTFTPSSPTTTITKGTSLFSSSSSSPPQAASKSKSKQQEQLIERAKEIDPTLSAPDSDLGLGSYCTAGWSNRLGTVLTPLAVPGVYGAERPFYWNKIDVGGRMAVIELPKKDTTNTAKPDLFIHSPVNLDAALKIALEQIGTVKHIVSPNYEHVKYAKMWNDAYPDANMWACPGLMEREPEVSWAGEIPFSCRPPSFYTSDSSSSSEPVDGMWDWDIIQPFHLDTELNPFTNRPFFNEVVFFHTPSKTLLTTDVYWNYPSGDGVPNSHYRPFESDSDKRDDDNEKFSWELAPSVKKIPFGTKLWKIGMDKVYKPFYMNLMIKDNRREEFEKCASFISGISSSGSPCWPIETVVPAHGDVIRGPKFVRAIMKDFFNL
mmetsp:Transcript_7325/g.11153  ORF Transcript_7325/g.11153 Transcript_7325/m.11153 type:complete len:408 (+) Transcript_7325:46-1269(+)